MAKLSAYGRYELWRVEKTVENVTTKSYESAKDTKKFAMQSDGHLLSCFVAYWSDGQCHNYGWKVVKDAVGKIKVYTPDHYDTVKANLIAKGYIQTKGN